MFALQRGVSCELSAVRSLILRGLAIGVNSPGLVSIIHPRACGDLQTPRSSCCLRQIGRNNQWPMFFPPTVILILIICSALAVFWFVRVCLDDCYKEECVLRLKGIWNSNHWCLCKCVCVCVFLGTVQEKCHLKHQFVLSNIKQEFCLGINLIWRCDREMLKKTQNSDTLNNKPGVNTKNTELWCQNITPILLKHASKPSLAFYRLLWAWSGCSCPVTAGWFIPDLLWTDRHKNYKFYQVNDN